MVSYFQQQPNNSTTQQQPMSYMLLCVLPNEIVTTIYDFKRENAKSVINNYLRIAKMRRAAFLSCIEFSVMSLYTITIDGKPDELIQKVHTNLTILLNSQFSRSTYNREMWRKLLNRVSKLLMYFYNKLATNNCLKNSNINYKYFKASVELWFKLCQKNYFWLYLSYLKTTKKSDRIVKAIIFKTIKNFADFRWSPIIVPDGLPSQWLGSELMRNCLYNYKLTTGTQRERSRY